MYKTIAKYYDLLGWGEFHDVAWPRLRPLLIKEEVKSYLDLACGTGTLAFSVARLGIEVVGIDKSKDMLEIANKNLRRFTVSPAPEFIRRDMTCFNLKQQFDAVGCFYDAVNHILTEKGFADMIRCVVNHLKPGGFFMFDVNTVLGMRRWDAVLFSKTGEHALLMKGKYDVASRLAQITISGFVQLGRKKRDDFKETFHERAYPHAEIVRMLKQAGFRKISAKSTKEGQSLRSAHRVFYTAYKNG